MIVNLGSIEIEPELLRKIRKQTFGISGRATRVEARNFCLNAIMEELALLDALSDDTAEPDAGDEEEDVDLTPSDPPVLTVVTLPSRQALYA